MKQPIVLLNCVGLTKRLLPFAPRLSQAVSWVADMPEVLPAVTCTAQATILTGKRPREHGIVANGWLFKDTMEVRFWQQSNRLMQAEPLYETLKKRNPNFKCAKLFWWFNQGAKVDFSVTPKPWYGHDGSKVFDIATTPTGLASKLVAKHGAFPFSAFWGPLAGIRSTAWIAETSATIIRDERPDLTLVYLPHLDYDPQRFGPSGCNMAMCVKELDDACEQLLNAACAIGAQVWLVSEYGHCDVTTPVFLNRILRQAGLLSVRDGPFGEMLDTFASRAFAVVDHQLAHIYVSDASDIARVRDLVAPLGRFHEPEHERSGDIVLLARPGEWFAYNFWLDDSKAPDYAKCIAIHAKPGFDPAEMFFESKFRAARRLVQKKLGFRTLFNVCPSEPTMVRGSHGMAAADRLDRPVLAGHGVSPGESIPMTSVRDLLMATLSC